MTVVRRLANEEMKLAVRLSDDTFRDAEQTSMGTAFPFIFSDAAAHLSYGAFEADGRLVAFMGLVPWTVRIGAAELSVLSLGSVCTEPSARGKGYASQLLQQVYAFAREAGASLLLVSGDRSLYTRNGCAPFGRVLRYRVNPAQAQTLLAGGRGEEGIVRELRADDLFALHAAMASRPVRYCLGVNELAMLLKAEAFASIMKMSQRVLVHESGGWIKGAAVIGVSRKSDGYGTVLEHAGDPEALAALFGEAVRRYGLSTLDVPVPWHERELQTKLDGIPDETENHPGTVGIMDGDALIDQLRPWLRERGDISELILKQREDGHWLLGRTGGPPPAIYTSQQLIRLIFDCSGARDEPAPEGAEAFRDLFPVPFPYTAGLCYI
ncbi:GNAT family N-acetyltransferase [Cohnella hashimotonis]|uniref:GNAT family N-acetyltransferase n=1 Tax=Cohnella hashimotonis TaxID=2826895 RepID=A0ABT6TCE7_9BACL|nr:GNAT family N-acetyltransferase [Cohnella hashimotonis]MDI4644511.1 GNAT family N-acetyltransferase [Cohnella hashimotonis]